MTVTERPSVPGYWYPASVAPTSDASVLPTGLPAESPEATVRPQTDAVSETAAAAETAVLTPVLDERERAVAVLHAVRRFRGSDTAMRTRTATELSVNATDLAALRHLVNAERLGEQVSPTELSAHLAISSAATTKLLNRLALLGHIRREPHPTDRRAQLIVATAEAHAAIRQVLGHSHARMLDVVTAFSADEQQTIIRFLDGLGAAVGENGDAPS
ncbi:MarR family transcriptional regulator [Cryobacterium melibiosiphilum]|uniref:MarR family transcriptional regulator n=1 Tax=Cryobacterium melibiosiphilum TaxID=995039 RepID=A0A3A5MP70_9MICO|nr:MarR family transcriptional regulator [Cryobacterium melibiosiphilum]RJT88743.1 MarR family transcriptional regulator [Cryobacterium melibiosiphilum]